MKYYVYAGYYENFISGHKLPKPYTLRDEFKTFDEALDYVWENWEDDAIFFTEDVIGDAIDNGFIDDENWENYLMKESKKSATKSIKEAKNNFNLYELQNYYPFKKEWENAIKSEGFKIHEVSGDKIVFAIDIDEGKFYNKLINAEIIIEDNMPIFLAKLLSWLKLDFGCSWTFGDEEEVNGYQYIDFMIW